LIPLGALIARGILRGMRAAVKMIALLGRHRLGLAGRRLSGSIRPIRRLSLSMLLGFATCAWLLAHGAHADGVREQSIGRLAVGALVRHPLHPDRFRTLFPDIRSARRAGALLPSPSC